MQKAIEDFIDIQSKLGTALDNIEDEIDKVGKTAIRKEREKQYIEWRNKNKRR